MNEGLVWWQQGLVWLLIAVVLYGVYATVWGGGIKALTGRIVDRVRDGGSSSRR